MLITECSPSHRSRIRVALLRWYDINKRDLPWRNTRDPYAIWISETMLQQTQVATVVPYYLRFMERFSTIEALGLQARNYAVSVANKGVDAIEQVKTNPPDILFLDLKMPEMDGAHTLKKIREHNKDLPVIIISAYLDDKTAKDASSYGISGVFYKGKDFQETLGLIDIAVKKHKK